MEAIEKDILRGGQFLVKETNCEDVFTPEDFSEEQKMMKDAVMEFNDREIIAHRERFEKKDFAFTEECMVKAGQLGFLGVANQNEFIFERLNFQYNSEIQQKSKLLSTLLEPFIIMIVGILVGVILIAMYLPMFRLSSVLG